MKASIASTILFVVSALTAALPNPVGLSRRYTTRIDVYKMTTLHENDPKTPYGPTNHGIVQKDAITGKDITTLVSFKMPYFPVLTGKPCQVFFSSPDIANGSKSFKLFDFVPNNGPTFNEYWATWDLRTGYRNTDLLPNGAFVVGKSSNPVYKFTCPAPGTIINYELVPSNGVVDIEWTSPQNGIYLGA